MHRTDERWAAAIDLLIEGVPKTQVAALVGVHRNTVNYWLKQPAFVVALQQRIVRVTLTRTQLRRFWEVTAAGDRLARLVKRALDQAEQHPDDPTRVAVAKDHLASYRLVRSEECIDQRVMVGETRLPAGRRTARRPAKRAARVR